MGQSPQGPFGDIPFFRELQKLLTSSGGGPINYDIAGQIANAIGNEGRFEPAPAGEANAAFAEVAHSSEQILAGATGLAPSEPALTKTLTRAGWIETSIRGWRWLLEPLAARFTGQLGAIGGDLGGEPGADEQGSGMGPSDMQAALGQMAPLMLGMQAGTLVGHLSKEVLGRFDLPIPYDDDGKLFCVVPNADATAAEYGFDRTTFYRWLALNETARGLLHSAAPWLTRYTRSLLVEVVESIEIDVAGLEERLGQLGTGDLEAMREGFGPQGALPVVPTERHRKALDRTDALLAVTEGYARRAVREVTETAIGDTTLIDEGMSRRHLAPSDGETMLAGVLGLNLDRSIESAGETFCNAVIKLEGLASLNRLWEAPDNLPSLAEVKDPFAWMERLQG